MRLSVHVLSRQLPPEDRGIWIITKFMLHNNVLVQATY